MAPSRKIAARRLEALAFFSDPERVRLVPGVDVAALVTRYANMRDKPADPKPGPSTAASVRELTETVTCSELSCPVPGSMINYGEWQAEGRRYGYQRPVEHRHTRIVPGLVTCPNCQKEIQLRTWWAHGCAGTGTAA